MLKQISLRIPKTLFDSINSLSKVEQIERSLLFRQALRKGIEQLRKEIAVDLVREDTLSISEAAKLACLGVGEMMDLLVKNGVQSDLSIEELEKDIENAMRIV